MGKSAAEWDLATKRIVALILLIALTLIVYHFRVVLPPLALAFLLAFILDPVVDFLEERTRLSRTAATALVFIVIVLALAAAPAVAVPPLVRAIGSLNLDFAQIVANVEQLMAQPIVVLGQEWDLRPVYREVWETLQTYLSGVATGTFDVVVGFASTLLWLIFILLSAFYMVRDANRLVAWADSLAPPPFREDFVRLRQQITDVWHAFLQGQLLMAIFLAVITTVAATIVGLPNALALGILAGVTEFVPNIGPVIAAIPALAVAFFEGSTWLPLNNLWFTVLVLGLYVVIQQIEGNVLLPRVMGQSLNLHPLVILIAIIAGGNLAGVLGMLLAAPMVATLLVLGGYVYRRLTDQAPFPEEARPPKAHRGLGWRLWNRVRRQALAEQRVIRPAQPEDRPDVEAISAQVWEGRDYVPDMWEKWLADPHGELTVVEWKGRVVAVGKLTRLADDEWWLEGLRVDPACRRLGVARSLQARQIAVAERVGQGTLRFGTGSYNRSVHRNATRDGFLRAATFVPLGAEPLPGPCPLRLLAAQELETVWEMIEDSPVLRAASGLYEVLWHWMDLTRERLAVHLAAGEAWGVELEGRLAAVAVVPEAPGAERLAVGYLDGTPEGITALTWGLRVLAGQRGYEMLRVRPPAHPPLLAAIEAAGATRIWEHDLWIFERYLLNK